LSIAILIFCLHILIGKVPIGIHQMFQLLQHPQQDSIPAFIIFQSRIPTALGAILAGGALSVAGLYMQTLFRNPIADPYILGVTSGSSLVVAFLIMGASVFNISFSKISFFDNSILMLSAMLGSLLFTLVILWFSLKVSHITTVLMIGLMMNSGVSAIISLLESMATKSSLQTFTFWNFGSFSGMNYLQLSMLFLFILIAILLSLPHLKGMNLLIGGELYAHSLGVNTKRLKMIIIIASAILAGVVTSFCGPIGFVGLAVPHLARVLLKSTNHLKLLPICFVLGATVCLLCSMIASLPFFDMQIPINIITSFIGAPVVIYILYTQKNKFQHG
jgi:iron complex transport system permease protein